jgi:hypothetical protein
MEKIARPALFFTDEFYIFYRLREKRDALSNGTSEYFNNTAPSK